MKKKFVILFILVVFLYSLIYADLSSLQNLFSYYNYNFDYNPVVFSTIFDLHQTDSIIFTAQRKSLTKKSVWVALAIAVFPGFFIHGLGHFYAGKPFVGSVLLICEIIGVSLIVVGIAIIAISGALLSPSIILTALTGTSVGVSETVSGIRTAIGLLNLGGILFIGSWCVDVIGAPLSCVIRNKKIQKEYDTTTIVPFLIVRF